MQDKILFQGWEVGDKKRVPVLMQVFGAVILFHVVALGAILYVPRLRDVFYLAQIFSNKGKSDSRDYKRTNLDFDSSDVVYVDPNALFQYPEGYFKDPKDPRFQQNAGEANGTTNFDGAPAISFSPTMPPPIVVNPTPSYVPSKNPPKYNTQRPSPKKSGGSALPPLSKGSSPFAKATPANSSLSEDKDGDGIPDNINNTINSAKSDKNKPKPSPSPISSPSSNSNTNNSEFVAEAWRDFGRKLKQNKSIDLNNIAKLEPTRIEVSGVLDKNGKLVMNPPPVPRKMFGDDNVARLSLDIVEAMDSSNMLTYLKALVGEGKESQNIKIVMEKGADNFEVFIESDIRGGAKKPDSIASTIRIGLNGFALVKTGKPEADFIKRIKVDNENGILKIKFQMPNDEAEKLIKKNLDGLDKPSERGENTAGNTKTSPVA